MRWTYCRHYQSVESFKRSVKFTLLLREIFNDINALSLIFFLNNYIPVNIKKLTETVHLAKVFLSKFLQRNYPQGRLKRALLMLWTLIIKALFFCLFLRSKKKWPQYNGTYQEISKLHTFFPKPIKKSQPSLPHIFFKQATIYPLTCRFAKYHLESFLHLLNLFILVHFIKPSKKNICDSM